MLAVREVRGRGEQVIKAFTTFTTPEDLDKEIDHLYDTLDTDESGGLTYEELEEGLRKLPFEPRIHISEEDFDAITEGKNLVSCTPLSETGARQAVRGADGACCGAQVNEEGEVDRPSFFAIVKRQMVAPPPPRSPCSAVEWLRHALCRREAGPVRELCVG